MDQTALLDRLTATLVGITELLGIGALDPALTLEAVQGHVRLALADARAIMALDDEEQCQLYDNEALVYAETTAAEQYAERRAERGYDYSEPF